MPLFHLKELSNYYISRLIEKYNIGGGGGGGGEQRYKR